jgi:hypothetical protein
VLSSVSVRDESSTRGRESDCESALALLERRWFAAHKRAELLRTDCEVLREVLETAHANWRDAVSELALMEATREALGEEIARHDATESWYPSGHYHAPQAV